MRSSHPSGGFRSARSVDARFRVLGPDATPQGPHHAVRTSNLGAGGAFLVTDDPRPVGTRVWIELLLPAPARGLITTGEVRWLRDSEEDPVRGMGVKFDKLSDDDLLVLGDFLATQTGRFSAA